MQYTISRAGADDIDSLKRLEVACELSPWTIEDYRAELERHDSVMLIARTPKLGVVGFIVGRIPEDGEAEIYNIGIDPSWRRQKIGGSLLDEFFSICTRRAIAAIWLEVRATNEPAISFYISRGFTERGVRPGFYSNPTEDAVVMSRRGS